MNLKKIAAQAGIAGALGFAALGVGAGFAHADPAQPWPGPGVPGAPGAPGHDRDWGARPADRDDFHGPGYPVDRDDWHGRWVNPPWGQGAPPWGWGPPPHPDWDDAHLPPPGAPWAAGPVNYWGYQEQPVWDPGFNQWGFWLAGVWIPL